LVEAPRILFVPVSGAFGMGEYARSLSIAQAAKRRWPAADIHFVLSRQAPYSSRTPFPVTLLASSPTFHSAAVNQLIESFRPHVVIFDNAGRTAQLRAGQQAGARVVYISARSRQRRKAFRWRWMKLIDEHWIAYPEFIAGRLDILERFKLKMLGRPAVRYLDVILSRDGVSGQESILRRVSLDADGYVLAVPGGGTGHPGASDAAQTFLAAANAIAQSGTPTVFVGPTDSALPNAQLRRFDSLPQGDLAELMRGARLVVSNGGSTLLQAIACGRACVAVPIAQDQAARIRRCVNAAVAVAAPLDSASILRTVAALLGDDLERNALARRAKELGLADGVNIALDALLQLLDTH
jgi:spore coat polysaccharide biosynthesis predicted glycosyltransferase SpsG